MSIINDLLRLNIELEGALRVEQNRHTPEAIEIAKDRLSKMSQLLAQLETPQPGSVVESTPIEAPTSIEAVVTEEVPVNEPEVITFEIPDDPAIEKPESESEPIVVAPEPQQNTQSVQAKAKIELRKAFTLNDKFLFRREIFNGSEQEFNDTLNLIESMSSLAEAQEYLLEDLQLDIENDTVNDFMGIITNYFVNR